MKTSDTAVNLCYLSFRKCYLSLTREPYQYAAKTVD